VVLETKESLRPKYPSDISNLFQNLLRIDCSSGISPAINQDSRDAAVLQNSSSALDPRLAKSLNLRPSPQLRLDFDFIDFILILRAN
jgi:hypothetical protein